MNKSLNFYYILILFVAFFTTCDLTCNYLELQPLALLCSVISGVLIFLGRNSLQSMKNKANEKIKFIKSNFNHFNLILSILDIICSIISVLSGIVAFGLIFRWVFALRLIIIFNKFKTVVRTIIISSFIWILIRFKGDENNMNIFKKIWNALKIACKYIFISNPKASISTLINASLSGVAGYSISADVVLSELPQLVILGIDIVPYAIALVLFVAIQVLGLKYAFEKNLEAGARKAEAKSEKEVAEAEKTQAEIEAEIVKIAEEKLAEEKLALAQAVAEADAKRLAEIVANLKAQAEAEKIAKDVSIETK